MGIHIITMKSLIEPSNWLSHSEFWTPLNATSWNRGLIRMNHYTRQSMKWTCSKCESQNEPLQTECSYCHRICRSKRSNNLPLCERVFNK